MSVLDIILNPFVLGGIALLGVGGIYILMKKPSLLSGSSNTVEPKKLIYLIRPGEKRGIVLPILHESARWLHAKPVDGIIRKFYKVGPGYMFPDGIKFFGVEGHGYTAIPKIGSSEKIIKTENNGPDILPPMGDIDNAVLNESEEQIIPAVIQTTTLTLAEYLKTVVWSEQIFNDMPKQLKDSVLNAVPGMTVEVQPVDEKSLGLKVVSEEAQREKDDETALKALVEDMDEKKKSKYDFQQLMIGGAIGALIVYIMVNQGWLKTAMTMVISQRLLNV